MEKQKEWQRVKEIVGDALERDPMARGTFLDHACFGNSELRAEVDSLLAAHADVVGLSENRWNPPSLETAAPSCEIGPYRLIRKLGAGGMGQVWLAEQTRPIRRRLALKLIRTGLYDDSLVRRFESERQSLALMEHPAIARVFDAGATPEGQPYFAMEYVDGPPITAYCDSRRLGIRARLLLFLQVCEGVQHAHQKAILHRDLKPSNILVVETDGKPTPRIIDFGLAKAMTPTVTDDPSLTQFGTYLGTPGYMSPEQADSQSHDVDTRADVYSLGVILYELLTGFLPFDLSQWKLRRMDEVLRLLRETDPRRPSSKIKAEKSSSLDSATARSTEPRQLAATLQGDLDCIAMKALEKDRERRYATPAALAADIGRYLDHRPVEARPESHGYRLSKYLRRNRLVVAAASGALAVLISFTAIQALQLRRITRERDRADRITEFTTDMFKLSDPSQARGTSITVREILDRSSKDIDSRLARDPELRAQMMKVMGTVYQHLGLYSQSSSLFRRSIDLDYATLGPNDPDTLAVRTALGHSLAQQGQLTESERIDRELLPIETRVLGADSRITLQSKADLAWTLDSEGRLAESETLARETLAAQQKKFGDDDPDTMRSMRGLAWTVAARGRYAEGEKLERQGLELRKRVLGPENPETLLAMMELGSILDYEKRYAEAEQILRQSLDLQMRILGPSHQNTLTSMNNLGIVLQHEKKLPEAEALYRQSAEVISKTLGPTNRGTLLSRLNIATVMEDTGRFADAEKLYKDVLDIQLRTLGRDHPDTALSLYDLADLYHKEKRYAESLSYFRQTMEIDRRILGPAHPDTLDALYNLACVLSLSGDSHGALDSLKELASAGYSDAQQLVTDDDLKALRNDPQFLTIVAAVKQHPPSGPK